MRMLISPSIRAARSRGTDHSEEDVKGGNDPRAQRSLTAMRPLHLAVLQFAPILRDLAGNSRHIARNAPRGECDLVVTPELSLTGYDVREDAPRLALRLVDDEPLPFAAADALSELDAPLLLGLLERSESTTAPFNTAALLHRGLLRFRHRKLYLPTYGMFDEGRYFARGSELAPVNLPAGWLGGVLVCEDFWHPGLVYVLAAAGIHVLIVMAAAPGRGVVEGGEAGGAFRSADAWERIARTMAQLFGVYVVLANRTGVEGAITFAGGSLIVEPAGEIVARGDPFNETVLLTRLEPDALAAARQPYSHAQDDDPRLVIRALERLLRP
jgi:predicted amidohydrolase